MTEPDAPQPSSEIPLSDSVVPPPIGAVPGVRPIPPTSANGVTGEGSGGITSPPGPYLGPPPDKDAKTMALLAHLLGIVTGFVGPLVIWLVKKEQPFVEDQAKEALNFELTILIGYLIAGALLKVFCIGALLWPVLFFTNLVLCIIAVTKANSGEAYRYPFALRIIK